MNLTLPVSGAWRTTAIDLGQWLPGGSADGRNRRVSPVPVCHGERLLTEPTPAAQPSRHEPLLLPLSGSWPAASRVDVSRWVLTGVRVPVSSTVDASTG